MSRRNEIALTVRCRSCCASPGRPCRSRDRHALDGCHPLRWKDAYQRIADERDARERAAARRMAEESLRPLNRWLDALEAAGDMGEPGAVAAPAPEPVDEARPALALVLGVAA